MVSEQMMTAHAKSKAAANLLRLGFIDFFGSRVQCLPLRKACSLAAVQMCFFWVKRKPRPKPAKFLSTPYEKPEHFQARFLGG